MNAATAVALEEAAERGSALEQHLSPMEQEILFDTRQEWWARQMELLDEESRSLVAG